MSTIERIAELQLQLERLNCSIYEPEQRLAIGEGDRLRRERDRVYGQLVELEEAWQADLADEQEGECSK